MGASERGAAVAKTVISQSLSSAEGITVAVANPLKTICGAKDFKTEMRKPSS